MNTNQIKQTIILAIVILMIALRFLLLDFANFAPIAAIGIFAIYHFSNKKLGFILPVLVLFLSDLIIQINTGSGLYLERGIDYLGLLAGIGIAYYIFKQKKSFLTAIAAVTLGSFAFFFISNLGVWAFGTMYAKTFGGLITCFEMAIPFYRTTLIGDLFFTGVFFGLYQLAITFLPENNAITQ